MIVHGLIGVLTVLMLLPLSVLLLYQWILAGVSFLVRSPAVTEGARTRFLVLVPAHNEETGIGATLKSIRDTDYPDNCKRILVVADRCTDRTAAVAKSHNVRCIERTTGLAGKGAAIAWGIQEAGRSSFDFDAVVIIDADTLVDGKLFKAFDAAFKAGHEIQQGYNYISNPWASPFTRIMAVTGVLRNARYYAGKTAIGLQGMLTGTGMCLAAKALERQGWSAFSVGEDWEFSAKLLLSGERIYFNPSAKTFARESQNLQQASQQRLRWASGRYAVVGNAAWAMFRKGILNRDVSLIDSALTLMAPNYSSQASFAFLCLLGGFFNHGDPNWGFTLPWALLVLAGTAGYFLLGVLSTESPSKAIAGVVLVPAFLPWRLSIELLGMLGYGRGHWGRASRQPASTRHGKE